MKIIVFLLLFAVLGFCQPRPSDGNIDIRPPKEVEEMRQYARQLLERRVSAAEKLAVLMALSSLQRISDYPILIIEAEPMVSTTP